MKQPVLYIPVLRLPSIANSALHFELPSHWYWFNFADCSAEQTFVNLVGGEAVKKYTLFYKKLLFFDSSTLFLYEELAQRQRGEKKCGPRERDRKLERGCVFFARFFIQYLLSEGLLRWKF